MTITTISAPSGNTVEVYGSGTTKRSSRAEMANRRTTLVEIAREAQPASVRHLYYRAVVAGLVEKKETGYRKVQRQILELRRTGVIPFGWITDEGRRAHWPTVDRSPAAALDYLAYSYRRDPWQYDHAPKVEIWTESESIAGVLMPLRDEYTVPIFPLKGQGSETFVWNAAAGYAAQHRSIIVLYAGDYDPAGLQIGVQLEGKLRKYAADSVDIDFRRVAITDQQANPLQALGTSPKQHHWIDYAGDRHDFEGQAIEAEAIDPKVLRSLFSTIIEQVAQDTSGVTDLFGESRAIEQVEREQLSDLSLQWGSA